MLSNCETYKDIFIFIRERFEVLKQVFQLKWKSPPVRSTVWKIITKVDLPSLEKVFQQINPEQLAKTGCFICVDGKILQESLSKVHDKDAIKMFKVFDEGAQIVLAHIPSEGEKDGETLAPEQFLVLLAKLGIEYTIVPADALHCPDKL
jgi:hypothetical protein